jgi:steroid Delta-isomerase
MADSPAYGAVQARHADLRLHRLITFYEGLAPADLARLDAVYAPGARFKDPFNDVRGHAAIRAVFEHMFEQLREPRFAVREALLDGDRAWLVWDFDFVSPGLGPAVQRIHGATHIAFAADGRVELHRDYWDAAEELYEKLPLIGALMRWLKRRAQRIQPLRRK